ncbi:MAG: SRPBCC domain-containing protein [Bacteroidota bacterium]
MTSLSPQHFTKTISISAPAQNVWRALTEPILMKQWLAETEVEILTDWQVGGSIIIQGPWYKSTMVADGVVLAFEPLWHLTYSQRSSLSRLPDVPESYSTLDFVLGPAEEQTALTFTVTGFPTDTIYRHLAFYWNVTLELLKKFIEAGMRPTSSP